jgi:hypothetical protein
MFHRPRIAGTPHVRQTVLSLLGGCVITGFLCVSDQRLHTQTTLLSAKNSGVSPASTPAHGKLDENRFVTIGGIEQWITIKADSCTKPGDPFHQQRSGQSAQGLYGRGVWRVEQGRHPRIVGSARRREDLWPQSAGG